MPSYCVRREMKEGACIAARPPYDLRARAVNETLLFDFILSLLSGLLRGFLCSEGCLQGVDRHGLKHLFALVAEDTCRGGYTPSSV